MDNLLYDVIDRPQFVHRLMDFITEGMVRYHRAREAA
jgi:uroporphyrinogen-III decarboxylase